MEGRVSFTLPSLSYFSNYVTKGVAMIYTIASTSKKKKVISLKIISSPMNESSEIAKCWDILVNSFQIRGNNSFLVTVVQNLYISWDNWEYSSIDYPSKNVILIREMLCKGLNMGWTKPDRLTFDSMRLYYEVWPLFFSALPQQGGQRECSLKTKK